VLPSTADVNMQQATVNLLADMGAQPGTLQANLVAASGTADVTVPAATIASPASGGTLLLGVDTTISGTATDSGGLVGAVEVSTDGGSTWHAATGTSTWSYIWTPGTLGTTTLVARAIDDSGNIGVGPSVSITVATSLPSSCPCSLWDDTTVPPIADAGADAPLELGVKFRADADGYITGIRFYKSSANTGA